MALQDFISHVRSIGLPLSSHFEVLLPAGNGDVSSAKTISMLCNSATIPGLNIMTNEIRTFGEVSEMPYGVMYGNATLTFYLDHNASAKRYFEQWSNEVFDRKLREVGFYNNFTRDIEIILYDREDNEVERVKLYEAYPKSFQEIPLDYGNHAVVMFNVSLVYKWWESLTEPKSTGEFNDKQIREKKYDQQEFGTEGILENLRPETLANLTGNTFVGQGLLASPENLFAASPFGMSTIGDSIFSETSRNLNSAASIFDISSIEVPGDVNFMPELSTTTRAFGRGMSGIGSGLNELGRSINDVTAPVATLSTAIGSVAMTVASFDNLLGRLGVSDSGLSKISNRLAQTAGELSVVSTLNGIPGSLQSVGANVTSTAAILEQALPTFRTQPGYTNSAGSAYNNMVNTTRRNGGLIGNAANTIQEYNSGYRY